MKVYLIRHGSTAGNLEHRYVGSTDEELTEEAVQKLRADRGRYPVPQTVITSPLKRCLQTARILFPEITPQVYEDLKECRFGAFEYKNFEELKDDSDYQRWIDSGGTIPFPEGESREAFIERCTGAFAEGILEARKSHHSSVAFVVHGGTIMAILDQYSSPHKDYFSWQVKNGLGFSGEVAFLEEEGKMKEIRIENIRPLPSLKEEIGIEDQVIMKNHKKMRCGYTTGSCAAAASKAAARMLLSGKSCEWSDLMTPKGIFLHLPILDGRFNETQAVCAVRKYGGDDPDATDGILIYAKAEKEGGLLPGDVSPKITIEGGAGVGRVTKPGLEQPVGAAAINRVPREMIRREVEQVCEEYEYEGGIKITIFVPEGERIGAKTFNPHIGIKGGISILGTSGIVVPMSEEALIASIRLEMKQKCANGDRFLLITPGNYGADFIRRKELSHALDAEHSMKCSNYVGETLDMAVELGVEGILFIAHIGKFIKVSGGIMNTHSAHGDCRAELMAAQAMRAASALREKKEPQSYPMGAEGLLKLEEQLLSSNTTEEAIGILKEADLLAPTIDEIIKRIQFHLQKRSKGAIRTEVVLFSNQYGFLGETEGAEKMMEELVRQEKSKKND